MELKEGFDIVEEGDEYALLMQEDGGAYVLRSKSDASSALIEGEDVSTFRTDYDTVKDQYPSYTADQILAQLWDQGGYSWMGEPDDS